MRLNPYLTFDGCCKAAFEFYEKCLNAKIVVVMTYGESPLAGQAPDGWHDKILHATLAWGDYVLQGADSLPGDYCKPQGFSVLLNLDTPAEAGRIFNALAQDGTIQIPLQKSFWPHVSARSLTDSVRRGRSTAENRINRTSTVVTSPSRT